jgi:two-component system, LytTR family, response regulator
MANRITTVIVDDETQSRVVLRSLLENFSGEIEIVGEAENVEEAFQLIQKLKPQLVFLDIQMPRGNGFTLLNRYENLPFQVIFVTSFDKYAINAIKFSALDYLLKPVEVKDLMEAVQKASLSIAKNQSNDPQIINLLHSLEPEQDNIKVAVHTGGNVLLLNTNSLVSIESDGSYCHLTTTENECYTTAKNLKEFEDYLGERSGFIRIHKGCLINVIHIKGYNKGEPCIIEMVNRKSYEVSRRKKQEVLEKLKGRL